MHFNGLIERASRPQCLFHLHWACIAAQVLLLDEITVDMDVVGRLDLLAFFEQECAERGASIVYATHIFDGLESWITHLAYVENGRLVQGDHFAYTCRMRSSAPLHMDLSCGRT